MIQVCVQWKLRCAYKDVPNGVVEMTLYSATFGSRLEPHLIEILQGDTESEICATLVFAVRSFMAVSTQGD
jgi:hypothetical protein